MAFLAIRALRARGSGGHCHVCRLPPTKPVDREQREGRVHRYKGHAIRKNLAQRFRSAMAGGPDPWAAMYRQARSECPPRTSEIQPFWVLAGDAAIERHVRSIPASLDEIRLTRLKRAVSLYRLAFGQLRQADLVEFLGRHLDVDRATRLSRDLLLNFEPPAAEDLPESRTHVGDSPPREDRV